MRGLSSKILPAAWRGLLASALVMLLSSAAALAQPAPARRGTPFSVTHYSGRTYRAEPQNWSVAQSPRGLIYVANNDGILQYDGARWRLIRTTTNTFVRSVAVDSQGTVYAGAVGDFGYLQPDSSGTLGYVSLSDEIAQGEGDFDDVWKIHLTDAGVYFQARKRLFRWDGEDMQSWTSEEGFHTSFVVRGQLYVREIGRGLLRMAHTADDDSLQLVPGGERFADTPIYMMVPRGKDHILVGTRTQFLLDYGGTAFTRFPTEADPLLRKHRIYHGCVLPGGEVAMATLGGGVLIIDREGRLVQVLNEKTALPGNVVNYVYPDGQGGLWMAMHNEGVVRAEVSSPLSRFGERFGLKGSVYSLQRYQGTLYVGTGAGLYALEWTWGEGHAKPHFEKISDVPLTWDLLSIGDLLLAATERGVYRVQAHRGEALERDEALTLVKSCHTPGRLYAGTGKGLALLQRDGNGWTLRLIAQTASEVRSLAETEDGALWFTTADGTVLHLPAAKLDAQDREDELLHPVPFDTSDGLPKDVSFVMALRGEPVAVSKRGLYRAMRTPAGPSFQPDTTLAGSADARDSLRALYEDDAGNAWLFYENRIDVARRQADGSYTRREPPALQRLPHADVRTLAGRADSILWIGNGDDLIRYDATRAAFLHRVAPPSRPELLFRQVRDVTSGTVLYGGAGTPDEPLTIPYDQNTLNARFALPAFGGDVPTTYQYRLRGRDDAWSAWSTEGRASLGKLREDTYSLQVRARTGTGKENAQTYQTALTLRVLPPWYRTLWAYLSYLVGSVLLGLGVWRYQRLKRESRRAQQQARELAREREARERLREANQQLDRANKLKENFLANTSHELRTPLTAILGYTEVLQDENPTRQQREFLDEIHQSGQRLSNTLNMLLEVAQLRAGVKELPTDQIDVVEEVHAALPALHSQAEEKGLAFHFKAPRAPIPAQLPTPYFRKIIWNLVDNAVKFTQEGEVTVSVEDEGTWVCIHVCDTGLGIKDALLPTLFEEFEQASDDTDHSYEGVGLGLTIAARLAHLMGGTIEVDSTEGEGSTFTACFPRYRSTAHRDGHGSVADRREET